MEIHSIQTITISLVIGIFSYVLARRLKIPAVLFYLFGGIIAGPVGFGIIDSRSLSTGLLTLVEIAVAIILFEGGLSLTTHSFRAESSAIKRILSVTIPLTGAGAALLAHYILDISWQFSIFFGAVIVVTGPTVIGSLLRSINLSRKLEILLNWESIWGDVIGVLLSAIALQMINIDFASDSPQQLFLVFGLRIISGAAIGAASGYIMARFILPAVVRMRDPGLPGIVAVACALATFFIANELFESSGPLAAAVAGYFLSHLQVDTLHEIRHFKEQLSSIFISTLFVLLSAYINPVPLAHMWPKMLFVAFILGAFVRPASVLLALAKSNVSWQERFFIGLIGPRGIIAVATMSYATFIVSGHTKEMELLLNLTFAIIFFSGATATILCKPVAKFLKVMVPVSGSGILLVGSNGLSSAIAKFASQFVPVAVLDRNTSSCSLDEALGAETVCADLLDSNVYEDASEEGFGRVLALTRSDSMNELITQRATIHLRPQYTFRALAGPTDSSIIRSTATDTNIAFSTKFFTTIAIKQLENNEASIEVLDPSIPNNSEQIIPLVQIVDKGKGVRIVRPDQTVNFESLCFVPKKSGGNE